MTNLMPSLSLVLLLAAAAAAGRASDEDVCGGRVGQVCTGCDELAVCARLDGVHALPVVSMKCPAYAPFCSSGRCVRYMDASNPCDIKPAVSTTFSCPGEGYTGYLPDPSSCSKYHYCVNGTAWDYDCRVGLNTMYDHARAACGPPSYYGCQRCTSRSAAYELYALDNTIAMHCSDPYGPSLVVCPENHRLDVQSGGNPPACVRYCPRDGRQAASDDPASKLYYECLLSASGGAAAAPVLKSCPDGSVFNAPQERCVSVGEPADDTPSLSDVIA